MYHIEPVQKVKVSVQVYEQMQNNIKQKLWPAGTKLPGENTLCQLFGVSRVTIRTAIHKLEAVGLLETRNGEGTFVCEVNPLEVWKPILNSMTLAPEDMIDTLELRRLLESHCCKNAAKKRTEKELEELTCCVEKMKEYAERGLIEDYTEYDNQFHTKIVEIGGSKIIYHVYCLLGETIKPQIFLMNQKLGLQLGLKYHIKLLEAIAQKDELKASEMIHANINDSEAEIRNQFQ